MSVERLNEMLQGPPEQATRWLDALARYGMVEAQTALGQVLLDGRGLRANPAHGRAWFAIAAEAGHAPAINMLGRCWERGWGGAVDHLQAAACYARAAALGSDWAQYNLANMKLRGRGVAQDRGEAWRLFNAAAAQGHAKSMNLVGRFLEEGWEVPRDLPAAAAWYRRSAELGDYRGQYNLATLLLRGGHAGEALAWFTRSLADATPDLLAVMAQELAGSPVDAIRAVAARAAQRLAEAGLAPIPEATTLAPAAAG